jgi:hypothetical protein
MVHDLERVAVGQGVRGLGVRDLHPQAPIADEQGEREPDQALGSRGVKLKVPSRSRKPPKPLTSAAQVPASEAM